MLRPDETLDHIDDSGKRSFQEREQPPYFSSLPDELSSTGNAIENALFIQDAQPTFEEQEMRHVLSRPDRFEME